MTEQIADNWYEDFFKGITCEIWENAMPPEYTSQEVDFVVAQMNLKPGQHILDIPCGFGRHAIELSKKGFNVTGVDISETFIKNLSQKIDAEKLTIKAIKTDILSLKLDQQFSGAICLGNSFGYFSFDKMNIFVKKVADSLEPGAKFIINSGMVAESILPNLANYAKNRTYNVGDIKMDVTNVYHVKEGFMVSELVYTKDGESEEQSFKHYVFTAGEINRLLAVYGLRTIAMYNSPSKTFYNAGDQQIYIVAEKE